MRGPHPRVAFSFSLAPMTRCGETVSRVAHTHETAGSTPATAISKPGHSIMPDDLTQAIEDAAKTPKSATQDGRSATARDIDELIKADQYAKAQRAAGKKGFGLRVAKIIPPGGG